MNSNSQAQKGFKTFILTLVISLVVFSAIYYVVNAGASTSSFDQETSSNDVSVLKARSESVETSTLGKSVVKKQMDVEKGTVAGAADKAPVKESAFEELASADMHIEPRVVLAETGVALDAAAEVEESTVPDTGILSPTYGLILSLIALSLAAYIIFVGPRNIALKHFEKDILDDLD